MKSDRDTPVIEPGLAGLDHFGLPVAERDRAEAFYRDVLGFPVLYRRGVAADEIARGFIPGTFFDAAGHPIAVFVSRESLPPFADPRGCPTIGFETTPDGLERLLARLESAGIPFEGPVDQDLDAPLARCVWLDDPDANHLQLGTPSARRAQSAAPAGAADVIGISHLELECTDLARALDFYTGLAGLGELRRGHDADGRPAAWLLFPTGQQLVLHEVAALHPRASAGYRFLGQHYAFDVRLTHWEPLVERLRAHGVGLDALEQTQTRHPVADGVYLVDPDGNPLQFQPLKTDLAPASTTTVSAAEGHAAAAG